MISDESSSDSETGRFKSKTDAREDRRKTDLKDDNVRSRNSRHTDDRFRREFARKRDDNDRFDRRSRERHSRISPVRRRHSRDRSSDRRRRSREKSRYVGDSRPRSKPTDDRNTIRDIRRRSRSRSKKREFKEEINRNIQPKLASKEGNSSKFDRARPRDRSSSTDMKEYKAKRSVIHKPAPEEKPKPKIEDPIALEQIESDASEEVQSGSYYSMIPVTANIKEKSEEDVKSEESSEIDSSDDERLRAKLLNLEKELYKTKRKKHKKKHKRRNSKSKLDKDGDNMIPVEVTSTTDISENKVIGIENIVVPETAEVTSTQKTNPKESSEEGELSSDDDSQNAVDIDPSDLRHRLKRVIPKSEASDSSDLRERLKSKPEGPALPPHLQKGISVSPDVEGPALPPHLKKEKNIGPSIPTELRKVLAEASGDVKYESSDDDIGIGPLPAAAKEKWTSAHERLEERALDIKIKKLDGHTMQSSDIKSREKWMLELPEGKAKILGLEARSFRAKEGPDMSDRSCWTDTPEQKERKAAGAAPEDPADSLQREAHAKYLAMRDQQQEEASKKHKKKHKREESLLDQHQKKLKKKKKKEEKEDGGKKERRPFSRDVDLQANRFDEAQKNSIIKKAQHLDTRFSRGEAKYL